MFALLAANVGLLSHGNVTLLNAAASDESRILEMEVPRARSDAWARVSVNAGGFSVFGVRVDSLPIMQRVSFVKIDVEGHELAVLAGIRQLLERDKPTVLVETQDQRAGSAPDASVPPGP